MPYKVRTASAFALLLCLPLALPATLHAQERAQFDLPSQPLAESLKALGVQTKMNVLVNPTLVDRFRAPALKASLTMSEALAQLLSGTGLEYHFVNDQTIVIRQRGAESSKAAVAERNAIRLAQADTPSESMQQDAGGADQNPQTTSASSPQEARFLLEEVIVTAQKRAERLIDVPISIVALSAEELRKRKVGGIDDLALAVPGLSVQSAGAWTRRIQLRGISNTFGSSSLIGMYLDEAPATTGSDLQLDLRTYDLERIEVLRGPQGTLYGEGSAGGTIRFITRDPNLIGFEMNGNVAASVTEDGGPSQRIEGVVNVPLIENTLGLRIAGSFDHQGGWIDQPAAKQKNFNEQNSANVRVKGLWAPTEQFAVNAMAVIHRNDASTNTGEDEDGNYIQTFNLTTTPSVEDDYDLYNLTLSYDFAGARLLSTSTYVNQYKEQRDYGFRLYDPGPVRPPQPQDVLKPLYTRDADIKSEELRLSSTGSGPWNWTFGAFYRHARIVNRNAFNFGFPGPPGTALPPVIPAPDNTRSESWAAFGDTSYRFAERFTVGAGLRYFEDSQEFNAGAPQMRTFDTLNPRFYLQYKLSEQINTYASAAKGFRSGGFNRVAGRPPFGPESVWTYELGSKMNLLDGRLATEVAVYYSDYQDYQINGFLPPPAPPFNITSNAGNARIKGVELSLAWRPNESWTFAVLGDRTKSEFYEINTIPGPGGSVGSNYVVGDPLDLFPKYSYTVSTEHNFNWSGRPGFLRLDYNEHGRENFRARRTGPWYFSQSDVINMLNFNASLDWSESLSLGLFTQNLLNDRGYLDPFSIEEIAARARPRTYGVQFSVTF